MSVSPKIEKIICEETAERILFPEFLASGFPLCLSMHALLIKLKSPTRLLLSGRKKIFQIGVEVSSFCLYRGHRY